VTAPIGGPVEALFATLQQAPRIGLLPSQFAQILDGALKTGERVWGRRTGKTRQQIGHSLTRQMGLDPIFFKAGAGSGEV
jgi:hypothetical protein